MTRFFPKIVLDFFKTYYTLLLICLLLLFIFRPYNHSIVYLAVWKVLFTCTILTAIFNCNHSSKTKIAEITLAVPTIIFCWLDIFISHPIIFIITTILNIVLLSLCTWTILADVFIKTKVSAETLKGVVCAYFLISIIFAYIFWLIEYFLPDSFFISPSHKEFYYYTQYLSEMIYFSFITLLTIGYGDIVAIRNLGQTAVVLEGLIGQFYVTILVARLVAAYSFSSNIKTLHNPPKHIDNPDDSP